ncbi:MAG: hypothetical protein JNN08_30500 [Bryobacterales bacterium]|nr:hypothetical protein [Bryobacterales bacterium]
MAQPLAPNQYELLGQGVRIDYSTSSFGGKPQLSLKKGRTTLSFTGDEIGVQDTKIGALITVTVASTPDLSSTSFSFLLPAIQLAKETAKQSFQTIGVTTVHKTTIAGPPKGVQQVYKSVQLRGSARQVEFLANKAAGA